MMWPVRGERKPSRRIISSRPWVKTVMAAGRCAWNCASSWVKIVRPGPFIHISSGPRAPWMIVMFCEAKWPMVGRKLSAMVTMPWRIWAPLASASPVAALNMVWNCWVVWPSATMEP